MLASKWNDAFELFDGFYLVSYIQVYVKSTVKI